MTEKRYSLKIVGQSGSGLLSVGMIIANSLRDMGFWVVADREYPSLIKGGASCFTINFCVQKIYGMERKSDIMLAIDKPSLVEFFPQLRENGILIHGYDRPLGIKNILAEAEEKNIKIVFYPARKEAQDQGKVIFQNTVLIGMLWKVIGGNYKLIFERTSAKFKKKQALLQTITHCLQKGYEGVENYFLLPQIPKISRKLLLDGNHAVALGAIHSGMRAYFAYPMSPASSILYHLANYAESKNIYVQQVEDEISVVQMALGASFSGMRSLCATSGGGLDLMSETVSLAGIIETPLTIVIAQRPGPATGLPTWTGQGDLQLAIYSGHGEYAKAVISISDNTDAFVRIGEAMDIAEKFQIPVILLTEKAIAEGVQTVAPFPKRTTPLDRGLVSDEELENLKNTDRYKITENGLSQRWLPGSSEAYYFANGDEHDEDGRLCESTPRAGDMYAKRIRKMKIIADAFPEPVIYGKKSAKISFVGWGSTLNIMRDVILWGESNNIDINYLHYSYLWPLKTDVLENFVSKNKNTHLIEGNHEGQLGKIIRSESGMYLKNRFLKWDGRPFFLEEVIEYVEKHI